MVWSSHSCLKNEKNFIDVTWPVMSGFANANYGGQNEFQTKMENFDAGVFFNRTGGILTRCDFDHLNLFRY